jgi:hypothetical protein
MSWSAGFLEPIAQRAFAGYPALFTPLTQHSINRQIAETK